MKYTIIERSSSYKLILCINTFIQEGWKPIGGVGWRTTNLDVNDGMYFQAMIKEDKNEV